MQWAFFTEGLFYAWVLVSCSTRSMLPTCIYLISVTARKDDAPAADQAAMSNVAGWCSISVGGGLIQTTSG